MKFGTTDKLPNPSAVSTGGDGTDTLGAQFPHMTRNDQQHSQLDPRFGGSAAIVSLNSSEPPGLKQSHHIGMLHSSNQFGMLSSDQNYKGIISSTKNLGAGAHLGHKGNGRFIDQNYNE